MNRKRCPVCHSENVTRINRTRMERLIGSFTRTHKYVCLICGQEFKEKARALQEPNLEHHAGHGS